MGGVAFYLEGKGDDPRDNDEYFEGPHNDGHENVVVLALRLQGFFGEVFSDDINEAVGGPDGAHGGQEKSRDPEKLQRRRVEPQQSQPIEPYPGHQGDSNWAYEIPF